MKNRVKKLPLPNTFTLKYITYYFFGCPYRPIILNLPTNPMIGHHLWMPPSISNFDELSFLSPLSKEGVTYLFRKPNAMQIESKPEIG